MPVLSDFARANMQASSTFEDMSSVDLLFSASTADADDQDQSMEGELGTAAGAQDQLTTSNDNDIDTPRSAPASTVYQMEFDVEHIGKNRPQNKRQALWRYCISTPGDDGTTTICEQ